MFKLQLTGKEVVVLLRNQGNVTVYTIDGVMPDFGTWVFANGVRPECEAIVVSSDLVDDKRRGEIETFRSMLHGAVKEVVPHVAEGPLCCLVRRVDVDLCSWKPTNSEI